MLDIETPEKRCCSWGPCETLLSIYNQGDFCFIHKDHEGEGTKKRIVSKTNLSWRSTIAQISPVDCIELTDSIILTQVAQAYGVSVREIRGDSREASIVWMRHVAAFLIRMDLGKSYSAISIAIGLTNPESSKKAVVHVREAMENDLAIKEAVEKIQASYTEGLRE